MTEKYMQLIEVYKQFAFINAVLGGFIFAYLGSLLTASLDHRLLNWIIGLSIFSAICFILITLVSMLSSLVLSAKFSANVETLPNQVVFVRPFVFTLFFLGMQSLLMSLGLSGWLRSKALGWASSILAVLGMIVVIITVLIF